MRSRLIREVMRVPIHTIPGNTIDVLPLAVLTALSFQIRVTIRVTSFQQIRVAITGFRRISVTRAALSAGVSSVRSRKVT